MEDKIFKDFLGRTVEVGDYIFYSTTGRNAESRFCRVSRFTAKTMFVRIVKHNRPSNYSYGEEVKVQNDFVRVADGHFPDGCPISIGTLYPVWFAPDGARVVDITPYTGRFSDHFDAVLHLHASDTRSGVLEMAVKL